MQELPSSGSWRRPAYALTGGFAAPCQRVADFLTGRPSAGPGTVRPSYRPGVVYTDLRRCLPDFIGETLALALPVLGRYLKGYDDPDALLTGVETPLVLPGALGA